MEQIPCWLRRNWLVILHLAGTIQLLLTVRFFDSFLRPYLGERSNVVLSLERSSFPLFTGWLVCQIGLIALWCALAQPMALRRLERALALLTIGWVILQVFYLAGRPNPSPRPIEFPLMIAVGAVIFFVPTVLFAWCFRFQNRWRLLAPHDPPQITWQFTLAELFRITSLACVVFALAAATNQMFAPLVLDRGMVPWYFYSLLVSATATNLLVVPVLLLGVWGLSSDIESRFRTSAAVFGGSFLLNLVAMLIVLPPIHNYPLTPFFESISAFFAGLLVPGFMTAWLVRRAGSRLVLLPTDRAIRAMMQEL